MTTYLLWRSYLPNLILATTILLFGSLIYLVDRQSVMFTGSIEFLRQNNLPSIGLMGGNIPSLCHAYAFTIIMACALPVSRRVHYIAASIWLTTSYAFEIGQSEIIAEKVDYMLIHSLGSFNLEQFGQYFRNGTFDVWDIVAASLGVALAFVQLGYVFPIYKKE